MNFRNWIIRRLRIRTSNWRSCELGSGVWIDRHYVVLHSARTGRTGCCLPRRWIFRRICFKVSRSCMGLCHGLEVRWHFPTDYAISFDTDSPSYALSWLVALPLEIVAASITLSFWEGARSVNPAAWVTIFLVVIIRYFTPWSLLCCSEFRTNTKIQHQPFRCSRLWRS